MANVGHTGRANTRHQPAMQMEKPRKPSSPPLRRRRVGLSSQAIDKRTTENTVEFARKISES
jgi:hypothetical protein